MTIAGTVERRSGRAAAKHHVASEWKLEDAKARFSEVVRRAESDGPQIVTVRGQEKAVVLSIDEFRRRDPERKEKTMGEVLNGLDFAGMTFERVTDGDIDEYRKVNDLIEKLTGGLD